MIKKSKAVVSLDLESQDFRGHDSKLDELIYESMQLNADETGQATAELRAGQQYLRVPRARRDLIEELLVKPLKELEGSPSERIRRMASEYIDWLLKSLA